MVYNTLFFLLANLKGTPEEEIERGTSSPICLCAISAQKLGNRSSAGRFGMLLLPSATTIHGIRVNFTSHALPCMDSIRLLIVQLLRITWGGGAAFKLCLQPHRYVMDASVLCALLLFATAAVTAGSVHDFIIIIVQVNNNWSLFCFSITRSEAGRVY